MSTIASISHAFLQPVPYNDRRFCQPHRSNQGISQTACLAGN
jgi:hypothetical protein